MKPLYQSIHPNYSNPGKQNIILYLLSHRYNKDKRSAYFKYKYDLIPPAVTA